MAFAFGLLHGFGFAGALADIGLPREQLASSLLLFNLGIEAGQLAGDRPAAQRRAWLVKRAMGGPLPGARAHLHRRHGLRRRALDHRPRDAGIVTHLAYNSRSLTWGTHAHLTARGGRCHARRCAAGVDVGGGSRRACRARPKPQTGPEPYEETLRLALETARPGDVIAVPPGTHAFTRRLVLNVDGVTIRGAGMSESVLSFAGQIAGAEGLLVNASDFTIEDLAIEDTIGDALKINGGSQHRHPPGAHRMDQRARTPTTVPTASIRC
jgi:hypothetical protein